ncbi:MAG: permease [Nanoarchaeota archaeon]|nr:permease [Nanoarchaeota archaeon]MBU1632249.1 permease [Nanoarchaeota archaeon]MBU1876056.1 permease [Nanoarchaeota archaeon]
MERKDWNLLIWIVILFGLLYFVPSSTDWFRTSILSAFDLLHEYAREHVLTCLVPALFIAGAIAIFIKKEKVMKYLGHEAKKYVSYGVASVSGAILAVCSCTILPLFAGIRKRGAGLGPAITFLFAGPAINIAAIFLTMGVLGIKIGLARIVFAISISISVGLTMALIFREKVEKEKLLIKQTEESKISNKILMIFFGLMIGVLVVNGLQIDKIIKYSLMGIFTVGVVGLVWWKFKDHVAQKWLNETWNFSKMLLPLLFVGVFIAGFIMPLLPQTLIENLVGQNTIIGNLIASIFGAFMYFSTLTEIPILQALIAKGMHSGPALALLLAGPSLSLPNMLVVRKVLGTKKTAIYIGLVVVYSTIAGLIFGSFI